MHIVYVVQTMSRIYITMYTVQICDPVCEKGTSGEFCEN